MIWMSFFEFMSSFIWWGFLMIRIAFMRRGTYTHKFYTNRDGFLSTSGSYENKLCSLFISIVPRFWELKESKKNIIYFKGEMKNKWIRIHFVCQYKNQHRLRPADESRMPWNVEMKGNKKKKCPTDSLKFFFNRFLTVSLSSVSNRNGRPSQRMAIN